MDPEHYLKALDAPSVSGTELRHEPGFQEIERLLEAATRAARTADDGQISLTANVDWDGLLGTAQDLSETGRDLRLLVKVCRAWTNQSGFAGLAAGLDLLTQSLATFWDSIHPELRDRPDPGEASLRRRNALQQIENDDDGVLGDLEMMAVFDIRGIGPLRGSELILGSTTEFEFINEAPSGLGDAEEAALKASFGSISTRAQSACRAIATEDRDRAETLLADIIAANAARATLEATFVEKAGLQNGAGLRLGQLERFLSRAETSIQAGLDAVGDGGGDATGEPPMETPSQAAPAAELAANPAASGDAPAGVNSRKDVERCLDMIIGFYERTEPSSPIPHLARRMRRMVPMDFVQLMEEIAPSGMKEFKSVAGVDDKKNSE